MTDLALQAERDDWKRRAEANHAACEAMRRQLEECAEAKASAERVAAKLEERYRLLEENYLAVMADNRRMKSDREFSV
jgi:hypothetical protein